LGKVFDFVKEAKQIIFRLLFREDRSPGGLDEFGHFSWVRGWGRFFVRVNGTEFACLGRWD